jgi:hypothetical protein
VQRKAVPGWDDEPRPATSTAVEEASAERGEEGVDEAEVERYAVHLGMNPKEDEALYWIAEQALLAPLPPQWVEVLTAGDATGELAGWR